MSSSASAFQNPLLSDADTVPVTMTLWVAPGDVPWADAQLFEDRVDEVSMAAAAKLGGYTGLKAWGGWLEDGVSQRERSVVLEKQALYREYEFPAFLGYDVLTERMTGKRMPFRIQARKFLELAVELRRAYDQTAVLVKFDVGQTPFLAFVEEGGRAGGLLNELLANMAEIADEAMAPRP